MENRQPGLTVPKRSLLYSQSDSDSESDSSGDYMLATDNNNSQLSQPSLTDQLFIDENFGHDDEKNCYEEIPPPTALTPVSPVIENLDSTSRSRTSAPLPMTVKRGVLHERKNEQMDSAVGSSLKKCDTENYVLKNKLEQLEKEHSAVIAKLNQDHQFQNDQLQSEGEEELAATRKELEQLKFQSETKDAAHAAETSRLKHELNYQCRATKQLQSDCDFCIDFAFSDCESRIGQFLVLQEENKDLQSKNQLMLKEIEELQKQFESRNNLMSKELEEFRKEVEVKNAKLLTLTGKANDLEMQNEHTCSKLRQKDEEIVTITEKMNISEKLNDTLCNKLQECEATLKNKCMEISNLQVENSKLRQQCKLLEEESTEIQILLNEEVKNMKEQRKTLQNLYQKVVDLLTKTENMLKDNSYLNEFQKQKATIGEFIQKTETTIQTSKTAIQNHVVQFHVSLEKEQCLKNKVVGKMTSFRSLYEEYKKHHQNSLKVSEEAKELMKDTLEEIEAIRLWNETCGKHYNRSLRGDLAAESVDETPVMTNFVEKITTVYLDKEDDEDFKIGLDVHTMCLQKNLKVTETSYSGQFVSLITITPNDEQSHNTPAETLAIGYATDPETAFKKAVDNLRHNKAVKKKRTYVAKAQ